MDEFLVRAGINATSAILVEPVKHIINTWLKPKLEDIKNQNHINDKLEEFISDIFSEYIKKTFNEQSFINIIALGLQQIKIDQIYVPLTLCSTEKTELIQIENFPNDLANKYKRVVIEDTAGMGKSTLMKKMFLSVIEKNLGIPVFIELRNLTKEMDIVDYIFETLNKLNQKHSKEFVLEVINRGDFIFFFDGYDEISFQHKQAVTGNLKRFISNASENIFFLTSRPDDSLLSFGQFQKFEILDLNKDEAFRLIERCDEITGLDLSEKIINQINEYFETKGYSALETFLTNPLLVSFLYVTFKHKNNLPSLKIDLYRKVFDALYELHDLSKDSFKREKYCGLSSGNLQKILMKLGFLCLKENVNDYDKGKIIKLISQAKDTSYFSEVQEENILKDLIETVPLLTKIGFRFKWVHKSFIDYFSAYFIDSHEKREQILDTVYKSRNLSVYLNMLDFYYEIDKKLFDKVFVYPILRQFINFVEAFCSDPSKKSKQIEYLELVYNRLFIFKPTVFEIGEKLDFQDQERLIVETYEKSIPFIKNYTLTRIMETTSLRGSLECYLFVKEKRFEYILKLLMSKENTLVKPIDYCEGFRLEKDLFLSWEQTQKEHLSDKELTLRLALIKENFGESNQTRRRLDHGLFRIDYVEALKYKELIEKDIKNSEDDLFLNL